MQVVLLERIAKLGQMGDVVNVKDGYARNFLLPEGKALRANKGNLERFEKERAHLEAKSLKLKSEADAVKEKTRWPKPCYYPPIRRNGATLWLGQHP